MKAFASLGTAVLFLSLGSIVPAFAQHGQEEAKPEQKQQQEHAQPQQQQHAHRTWQQRGGYHGYRIPENRYNGYFGPNYGFVSKFSGGKSSFLRPGRITAG